MISAVCLGSYAGAAETNKSALKVRPGAAATNALASFRLHEGFRLELAAAEPMVSAPVALAFDENGRLFVAEAVNPGESLSSSRGRVRLLEDPDEEGVYRSSRIYADDLAPISALACYGGGLFVGTAPVIIYLKDTQGDGLADVRRTVLSGFGSTNGLNQRLNSFAWGLDNRIHGASGGAGGLILASNSPTPPVSITGADFSFDPRSLTVWPEAGPGVSGMSFDNFGRKYVSSPAHPLQTAAYDPKYFARDPFFVRAGELAGVLNGPLTVFRASPGTNGVEDKLNMLTRTLATNLQGCLIYRGSLFPSAFQGNAFIPCPDARLIHRVVIAEAGLTARASRAVEEQKTEFLVSSDPQFFPAQAVAGPEGALYVCDRRNGMEQGRIYRIVPSGYKQQRLPQLSKARTLELVTALTSPNGWHRDTAARLLYERQDRAAVSLLSNMVTVAQSPLARVQALHALDGLQALALPQVLNCLRFTNSAVREHALQLLGRVAGQTRATEDLWQELARLAIDPSPRIRLQLAFTLGDVAGPEQTPALAQLLKRDPTNPWLETAVLSSSATAGGRLFTLLAADEAFAGSTGGMQFLQRLGNSIGLKGQSDEIAYVLAFFGESKLEISRAVALLWPVGEGLRRTGSSLALVDPQAKLQRYYSAALDIVISSGGSTATRVDAIRLIEVSPLTYKDAGDWLLAVADPQPFTEVRSAAISALGNYDDQAVVNGLLNRWNNYTPQLKTQALAALLRRDNRWRAVMEATAGNRIAPADFSPEQMNLLRACPDPVVSARAYQVFGSMTNARPALQTLVKSALKLRGNRSQGREIFLNACAVCHQHENAGRAVGPDLTGARLRPRESLYEKIVEPNGATNPGYSTTLLRTGQGEIQTGIITDNNLYTVTLKQPQAAATWAKAGIERLETQNWSLMPDTFGLLLSPQNLADLAEYLTAP
jgi:putative membrane-bound dehydrogenase-like protein